MFQEFKKLQNFIPQRTHFVLLMKIDIESESHELFEPRSFRTKHRAYNRWMLQQNLEYITFLHQFKRDFDQEHTRRVTKVFKRLSNFMKTKSETQCKSHHQKMLRQYGSIENIISHFLKRLAAEADNNKKPKQTSKPKLNEQSEDRSQCSVEIKKKVTQITETTYHDNPTKSIINMASIVHTISEGSQEQFDNTKNFSVSNANQTLFDVLHQEVLMNY